MSDDLVVPQGEGRAVDCPLCGGKNRLYLFGVAGRMYVHCGRCQARRGPLDPNLTIAQCKSALIGRTN